MEIDSIVLFHGMILTTITRMGMIRKNYNVIDGINFKAEAKRFAHKTIQKGNRKNQTENKLTRSKNKFPRSCRETFHHVIFSWCKFNYSATTE